MRLRERIEFSVEIKGSVALVTGANRGLGQAIARTLLERGAARVYGAARRVDTITDADVVPIELDVTDPTQVQRVAQQCGDVTLLVNNAGVITAEPLMSMPDLDSARAVMETNCWSMLTMCRAFAPTLAAGGGGAIVNILSVASWVGVPDSGPYSMAKAAAWALTNCVRIELSSQGTLVVGVHSGYIDTDMVADFSGPKTSPDDVASQIAEGVEAGSLEVLTDEAAHQVKAALSLDPGLLYARIQDSWDRTHGS